MLGENAPDLYDVLDVIRRVRLRAHDEHAVEQVWREAVGAPVLGVGPGDPYRVDPGRKRRGFGIPLVAVIGRSFRLSVAP